MIETPTLFVLGAGASHPYGYPLGLKLRELICGAQNLGDRALLAIVNDTDEFTKTDIRDFAAQFAQSNVNSIDDFLSRHAHLVPVGKRLIAAHICLNEIPENIHNETNDDHWYRYLWNALIRGTSTSVDLKQNNVRVLTFNYDRSLEFFLREAIRDTYRVDRNAVNTAISYVPILHVYGSVGAEAFPPSANRTRSYGGKLVGGDLALAAHGINIIPEGRDDAKEFKTGREWFDWARRVYVLGFGFDPLNCKRLGFESVVESKKGVNLPGVFISGYKMTDTEVHAAHENFVGYQLHWVTHKLQNTMVLRESGLPA